jgi:hypothetical protein
MDANNLDMVVTNHGSFAFDLITGNAGLVYPKGSTNTVVFAAGPWIGARVGFLPFGGETRVSVGEYSQDFIQGPMRNGVFQPDEPAFKSYKIVRGNTTSPDYFNWPTSQGAPLDKDGKPLLLGDATIWSIYSDADPSRQGFTKTAPLGIEIQQTTFAFNRSGPLGNIIFLLFKVTNKGEDQLDDVYFSLWSDPDLGGFTDDLVGCDTTLSMGYCYNATNSDAMYGAQPPAVGYCLLRGPAIPRSAGVYDTLGMSSFIKYMSGTDPFLPDDYYNYMQGLHADGTPMHVNDDPALPTTTYQVSGDPVTGTGWLDSDPADRRLTISTGPFFLGPGYTHEIAAAILVGQGSDRLSSLSDLRNLAQVARQAYRDLFAEPGGVPAPSYLTQWGEPAQLHNPTGVAIDSHGDVFVTANIGVSKFTGSGTLLTQWGTPGSGNSQFQYPSAVATDAEGNVYVADDQLHRIQKFTGSGTYLAQWGSRGSGNGQFESPDGVATDPSGNVYVVDRGNSRIQKFTGTGLYLTQWGSQGHGNGQFSFPTSVAADASGNIYVVDLSNHRIQKFTGTGAYITQWGSFGGGHGQFNTPFGVATDAAGNVYVADTGNHRIQKFDGVGAYLTQWGSFGTGNGQFRDPSALATDGAGNVFVADRSNHRIQKFGVQATTLAAAVDLDPNVINQENHAPWVTAYIEPSGFDVVSIDFASLHLAGSVPVAPKFGVVGDRDRNGKPELMVKFARAALDPLLTLGENELEVTGRLVTGEEFKGSDRIRVIRPGHDSQAAFMAPNPLNPTGILTFQNAKTGPVTVKMFDLQGRLVRTLAEIPRLPAGVHELRFDGLGDGGKALASGVYFYRIETAAGLQTGRLAILK